MKNKKLKLALKILGLAALACLVSHGSGLIENRMEEGLGVVAKWGVPLSFKQTALGIAVGGMDVPRYLFNAAIWLALILIVDRLFAAWIKKKAVKEAPAE